VPPEVFVDAGAWIALNDRRDAYHQDALETYRRLLEQSRTLVTTNLVISEGYVVIRQAGGHRPAMRFLAALRQSNRVVKVYSEAVLEERAEHILTQYDDQDFSFADAVSFAVMQQRGLGEAFGFDRHFLTAGFALVPPRV
jgi:predicted nucleic acid-binding protein